MIPFRLLVAIVLAAEVVATVFVAQQLGVLWTFAWWFVSFVLGVLVIRRAGARAWAGLRSAAMRTGPTRQRVAPGDTALLFLAGALLAVPGVLTDVLGVLLLLPAGRRFVSRQVARRVEGRFTAATGAVFVRTDDPVVQGGVVQAGEIVEEDPLPTDDDERPGEGGPRRLPPG